MLTSFSLCFSRMVQLCKCFIENYPLSFVNLPLSRSLIITISASFYSSDIPSRRARQGATLSILKFTRRTSTVATLSLTPPPTQSSGDDLVRLETGDWRRESTIRESGDSKYIIGRKLVVMSCQPWIHRASVLRVQLSRM